MEDSVKTQQIEEEILYQLLQGNFQFAEKLINIFQNNSIEKRNWGFRYKKDKIEIDFGFEGTKSWWKNGRLHRDGDKPAIIRADGTKEWWKNGERHRDGDKPAIVYANGTKKWYKNGKHYRDGDKPTIIYTDGSKQWRVRMVGWLERKNKWIML